VQSASLLILSLESTVKWFAISIMRRHSRFVGPEANFTLKHLNDMNLHKIDCLRRTAHISGTALSPVVFPSGTAVCFSSSAEMF
jgi:hypothetical protein